jgi:hypothetical protein
VATQIRARLYNLVGIKSHSRNIDEHLVPTWSEKSGYSDRLLGYHKILGAVTGMEMTPEQTDGEDAVIETPR